LTIIKLKQWHSEDEIRLNSLAIQEKQLQNEINEFVNAAISGKISREKLTFASNKVYKQEEFDRELDTDKPYKNFRDRINVHKDQLTSLLKMLQKEGKSVHVYGASTKGNTILQWCGIDNRLVDLAAERNPDKYGAYTLGTDIPIVSEAESRAMKPDYYLVLPWHFKEEFIQREQEVLKSGVGMIFPLPNIEMIKY
jgi:hypothetical protein